MNDALPISAYKQEILSTIASNSVTIIKAETGAGKTTQVPQYLLEAGYRFVITQPRVLAARSIAQRVASEYGCTLGKEVGYRTARERKDSPKTQCLFCTDGLVLARELTGTESFDLVIIDETHLWSTDIDLLVSWYKGVIAEDPNFKLVLMSATMDTERLSRFFDGAPVINVPGRLFPVQELQPQGYTLEDDVIRLLKEGRNVLVFQPGKKEITSTIEILQASDVAAEIIPLHGELSSEDQDRCFKSYQRPKCVVSTNVAETSITIDDIDAVVDSGFERIRDVVDGIEGLYLKPIALSNSKQRKGRAGRCKEGIYVDWCSELNRSEYPVPEILRMRLDQTVLRLAEAGFKMEEMNFFHQPSKVAIHQATESLKALRLMDSKTGKVTKLGSLVATFPISVHLGRMIVEADKRGVVADVLKIAAILEVGRITDNKSIAWRQFCPNETTSDAMAQLAVYNAVNAMNPKPKWEDVGIMGKNLERVKAKFVQLLQVVKDKVSRLSSSGDREAIIKSVCSGLVDNVYEYAGGEWERKGKYRRLGRESVLPPRSTRGLIVGVPFDLDLGEGHIMNLISMASVISIETLTEIAPHLVDVYDSEPYFSSEENSAALIREVIFNGHSFGQHEVLLPNFPDTDRLKLECRANS
jgi:ATP-dependent helicase HrpA